MEIQKGIEIFGLGLLTQDSLIISDIHVGYEEALNKKGVLVPRFQFKDLTKTLEGMFTSLPKLKRIIINGDLKHEFGTISETEWRHTLRLIDFLAKRCEKLILIRGNHDTILGPIAKKRNIIVKDHEILKDILIVHGHNLVEERFLKQKKIKTIIIGHEHPAIRLEDGPRTEKFKCFLKGKWKRYNLIVLPAFTPVQEGSDVLQENHLSPFVEDIDQFKAFIVGDKVYDFGKIKNLR
ncbi:metallophosphoesterase [Candidatus Woesearchaeota archaeon]|nr:metallophosphoesterase [Candidatus Woesearchaeota archaeon]